MRINGSRYGNNWKVKNYNAYTTWDCIIPQGLWAIWLRRNENLFNNKKELVDLRTSLEFATEFSLLIHNSKGGTKASNIIHVKWEPPDKKTFMLNTDSAVKLSPGQGGLGGSYETTRGLDYKVY